MAAYVIVDVDVKDQGAFEEYRRAVGPTIAQYGGKAIVRNGRFEVLEGDWTPKSIAVVEFPSMDAAKRWYDSPEYKPLIAQRKAASFATLVVVEGV